MLESIQIRHFAIIDKLQLEFDQGMTALTGETGAGKSILLDAIKLISGDRADIDSIKSGEDKAEISVCFNIDQHPQAHDWLQQQELSSAGECMIRRVLYANGRSKAFINGSSAPLSQLRQLTQMLVDLHGQHEHQSLQKPQVQQQLLDVYLDEAALLTTVRDKHDQWCDLRAQYDALKNGANQRQQRIDLLTSYCEEFNELNLAEHEVDQLQDDYRRLSHASQLLGACNEVLALLQDNDETTVQGMLSHCDKILAGQIQFDPALNNSYELIGSALLQVQEASRELHHYQHSIDLDAAQLDYLNQRIASIQTLARKHHLSPEDLPAHCMALNQELDELQNSHHDLASLAKSLQLAKNEFLDHASTLSTKRQQTAQALSTQITDVMQQLGMQGGQFSIQVKPSNDESDFRRNGIDKISYLVSANPGQPLKPLNKVASGGELSRISLAIQVILRESSDIPTLIFDEVDAGIGGCIAEIVGHKLRQLGHNRQVFCVTHLPQVASQAHHHYRVEKNKKTNNTTTQVTVLTDQHRQEEIARMLGGVNITAQTRAHASEMIATGNSADKQKSI